MIQRQLSNHLCRVCCLLLLISLTPRTPQFTARAVDINIKGVDAMIAELNDAASQLTGQVALQMKELIQELSDRIREQVDAIKNAGQDLIKTASAQLQKLLDELVSRARALLNEIHARLGKLVDCIDADLAAPIAQLRDSILETLDKIGKMVGETVKAIYVRSTELVDNSAAQATFVMSSTLTTAAKYGLIILGLVFLLMLLKLFIIGDASLNPVKTRVLAGLYVVLIGFAAYLVFSPMALIKLTGQQIRLPKEETSCANGEELGRTVFEMKNKSESADKLKEVGEKALENLAWCKYASISDAVAASKASEMEEIQAIIYPPPAPPPANPQPVPTSCVPGPTGTVEWRDPRWYSKYTIAQVSTLERLKQAQVLAPAAVIYSPASMTVAPAATEKKEAVAPSASVYRERVTMIRQIAAPQQ